MKFSSNSVIVTFCLFIIAVNGQVLYGTPYIAQVQQQYKYPLPYGYSYANQNQLYMQPQQQQQPSYYQPNVPGYPQQYGLPPQYPVPYYPSRPAMIEQIGEVVVPNNSPTKVLTASLETPIEDEGGNDAALLGFIAQADPNVHAEEYYWARADPSVTGQASGPDFRRATVSRPRQPATIKKPFSVKKRQHFELYKYH